MAEHPVTVRLDEATIERLDRIAEAMAKRVIRAAVEHGIESLEQELGLAKKKR